MLAVILVCFFFKKKKKKGGGKSKAFSIYKEYFLRNKLFLQVIVFYVSSVKNIGKRTEREK